MCCLFLLAGCSDSDSNGKHENKVECDNSYITACNDALTGYTVCRVGVITNIDCEIGQTCNPATKSCEAAQPSQCDANTAPVCNGKNARKICQSGQLVDDPCPENTECSEATATCEPVQPPAGECDENTAPVCSGKNARKICKSGQLVDDPCPENTECSEATATCEPVQPPAGECDENTAPVCNGKNARKICKSGQLVDDPCPENTECNESTATCEPVQPPAGECDENTAPVCNGKNARKICKNGSLIDDPCPANTECNEATATCEAISAPPSGECDGSFNETCPDSKHHTYCKEGQVVTEECKSGTICNPELKDKKCKTPAVSDKCDPSSFSESCYGTSEALTCEDGKVQKVDCVKTWGKGYQCDIVENYNDSGNDVALCYSKKEECSTAGDSYTECIFETENGYDQHYTITYVCVEGNLGYHYYYASEEKCAHKCNKDKTACSD